MEVIKAPNWENIWIAWVSQVSSTKKARGKINSKIIIKVTTWYLRQPERKTKIPILLIANYLFKYFGGNSVPDSDNDKSPYPFNDNEVSRGKLFSLSIYVPRNPLQLHLTSQCRELNVEQKFSDSLGTSKSCVISATAVLLFHTRAKPFLKGRTTMSL